MFPDKEQTAIVCSQLKRCWFCWKKRSRKTQAPPSWTPSFHVLESSKKQDISYEMVYISGSVRSYLEAYSDYMNPILEEMDKAEKMLVGYFKN